MTHKLEGKKAPDFLLTDSQGQSYSLKDFKSKYIVLFFYPKDNTPGCTIESKSFSKNLGKFKKLGVEVIGLSGGDDSSKQKFCTKHKLKTIMLSDTDFSVAKKYKSYGEKSFMGRKYKGIYRNTFVLDKSREIMAVFEEVSPVHHVEDLLKFFSLIS